MPPRRWQLRVTDILDAIDRIHDYTDGMTFEAFRGDGRTVDAVIRNLEIIGEASRHMPDDVKQQFTSIPWRAMLGLRNFAIHQYDQINLAVIWTTIRDDLQPIVPRLHEVLAESGEAADAP